MNYAYYRVSTDKQDYNSQKIGVLEYCNRTGIIINEEILDNGVSGTVEAKNRNLGKLLRKIQAGDTIITSELSRLGRSTTDVLNTCKIISDKNASCWFVKQGMGIDTSPMGKMMIAIFAAFSEMERDLISVRTREGLARVKASGKALGAKLGVPQNSIGKKIFAEYGDMIKRNFADGWSINRISERIGLSSTTISKWLKRESVFVQKKIHITNGTIGKYWDIDKPLPDGFYKGKIR